MEKRTLQWFGALMLLWLVPAAAAAPVTNTSPNEAYGIGVALAKHPGGFVVFKIVPDSPAALSGAITNGDLVIAVAQSNAPPVYLTNWDSVSDAVALVRGPKGSIVRLTIIPQATNVSQERVVSLARGELKGVKFGGIWLGLTNGATAPEIELLRLSDKQPFKLQHPPNKFLVIEFWATWCAPCLRLMPQTQNEAQRYGSQSGVAWLTVSLDDTPEMPAKRVDSAGWNKTVNLWGGQPAAQAFGIHSIPEMFVIDPQGVIVYHGSPIYGDAVERFLQPTKKG